MLKSTFPTKDFEFDQILAKVDDTRRGNTEQSCEESEIGLSFHSVSKTQATLLPHAEHRAELHC